LRARHPRNRFLVPRQPGLGQNRPRKTNGRSLEPGHGHAGQFYPSTTRVDLPLGVWDFFGVWRLEFGASMPMLAEPLNPSHPQASLIHPKALMSIRNLELRARIVVEGFWNGLHRSPYHGFSVEFTEYRQY